MSLHAVTLNLPDPLYDHFKRRAKRTHRSVEAELLEVVEIAGPQAADLPAGLAQAVRDLSTLGDEALLQVARDHLPREAATELEALNHKQQREGLDPAEKVALDRLCDSYERFLLLRAEAAGLLQQRGHDISGLILGG